MKTKLLIATTAMMLCLHGIASAQTTNDTKDQLDNGQLALLTALTTNNNDGTVNLPTTSRPTATLASATAGGAVAAGDLTVDTHSKASLSLQDETQSKAQAANLSNTADAQIANSANVWTSNRPPQQLSGLVPLELHSNTLVEQHNLAVQDTATGAQLGELTLSKAAATSHATSHEELTTSASVDTEIDILGQKIQSGSGGAGAGRFDLSIGSAEVSFKPKLTTKASAVFGLISGELTAEAPLTITSPTVDLNIDGAGCGAVSGSCSANGNDEKSSSSETGVASAPVFTMKNASADYIAGGSADITIGTDAALQMADSAQAEAKALNLTNAVASQVANGVNVATADGLSFANGNTFITRQTNVAIQRQ